jgi:hypothetical protein
MTKATFPLLSLSLHLAKRWHLVLCRFLLRRQLLSRI